MIWFLKSISMTRVSVSIWDNIECSECNSHCVILSQGLVNIFPSAVATSLWSSQPFSLTSPDSMSSSCSSINLLFRPNACQLRHPTIEIRTVHCMHVQPWEAGLPGFISRHLNNHLKIISNLLLTPVILTMYCSDIYRCVILQKWGFLSTRSGHWSLPF